MSFRLQEDGRVRFPICGEQGCGQATVDRLTLMHGSVDQVVTAIEEDASAQGLLMDAFTRGQLEQAVFDARAQVLAVEARQ